MSDSAYQQHLVDLAAELRPSTLLRIEHPGALRQLGDALKIEELGKLADDLELHRDAAISSGEHPLMSADLALKLQGLVDACTASTLHAHD